jgi:ribosomal protein S12 methylthiotransferase accessory factor
VWVPAELVLLPFSEPGAAPRFGWTTNGLASGNSLEEATLHAIFEVLERDAVAMNHARDASRWLPLDELPAPLAARALAWRSRGVELIVRELPNDFGLPCFQACLHESSSTDVNLAGGSGLHASRQIALARAVCEAAQSRLSIIHGGRDDITGFYAKYVRVQDGERARTESRLIEALRDPARRVALHEVAEAVPPAARPATLLRRLLRHLARRGFGTVLRLRIDTADRLLAAHGLFTVKVVVPRCETIEGMGPRVGPRLLARILARG